jgi:hypothetical protein
MNKELTQAIKSLRPTSEFSFIGDDYSTIKWDVLDGTAPTLKEVEAEIARLKIENVQNANAKAAAKSALLERLGITADEAALLLS